VLISKAKVKNSHQFRHALCKERLVEVSTRCFLHGSLMFDLLSKNDMVNTMDKALTVASRRMSLVASNVANIDTPDYKTRDLPFHETLQAVLRNEYRHSLPMSRTHEKHIPSPNGNASPFSSVNQVVNAYERNDGNDVNLDKETMKVMQTRGAYNQAALFTQSAIRRVLTAIREGGR